LLLFLQKISKKREISSTEKGGKERLFEISKWKCSGEGAEDEGERVLVEQKLLIV